MPFLPEISMLVRVTEPQSECGATNAAMKCRSRYYKINSSFVA